MLRWNDIIHFTQKGNPKPDQRIEKSEEEWKGLLTPEQYNIARKKGTESPYSGQYCEAHGPGKYACICCGTLLFDSAEKYDSHSGWPSFTQPVKPNAVKYEVDNSFGMKRVEIMCNTCDCHLGHIFPDGPEPSGLRYCVNSESIKKVE
ncbi:peptide-methionine (R)-S-oxide reductase MsrB [Cytophagaceae bacterium ABcell3]|nr:peptide-methionine (R)-S-oxide reductase MsrB [Cytophagaceae bacterium ABcell3]